MVTKVIIRYYYINSVSRYFVQICDGTFCKNLHCRLCSQMIEKYSDTNFHDIKIW